MRATHTTIRDVAEDYEAFHFNTAISKLMELTNAIAKARENGLAGTDAYAGAVDTLLRCWRPPRRTSPRSCGAARTAYSIHSQAWPASDATLATADTIELPVQVNGKLRDRLVVTRDTSQEEIERLALASEKVQAYLGGGAPRR